MVSLLPVSNMLSALFHEHGSRHSFFRFHETKKPVAMRKMMKIMLCKTYSCGKE